MPDISTAGWVIIFGSLYGLAMIGILFAWDRDRTNQRNRWMCSKGFKDWCE